MLEFVCFQVLACGYLVFLISNKYFICACLFTYGKIIGSAPLLGIYDVICSFVIVLYCFFFIFVNGVIVFYTISDNVQCKFVGE